MSSKAKCHVCDKEVSGSGMKKHMLTHVPQSEWPYSCPICGKRMQARQDVAKHLKTKAHVNDNIPMEGTKEWNDLLYHDKEGGHEPQKKKQKVDNQHFEQEEVISLDDLETEQDEISHAEVEYPASTHYFDLNSGYKMPAIQFGTYKLKGVDCFNACVSALRNGYRGFDTASIYDNEELVGRALKEFSDREEIFVQTKLWRSYHGADPKTGKPKCDAELKKSLRKLGLDYIDLWLLHWPGPGRHLNYPPVKQGMSRPKTVISDNEKIKVPTDWSPEMRLQTWKYMASNLGEKVGSIGVCNFSPRQLQELLDFCEQEGLPIPAVVQNECHPLLQAVKVRELCNSYGIVFQAYASLGAGSLKLLENEIVSNIANKLEVTSAQVLLRWAFQHGCAVVPKSVHSDRQRCNFDIFNFELPEEDMKELNSFESADKDQNTMVGWLREHDPDFY